MQRIASWAIIAGACILANGASAGGNPAGQDSTTDTGTATQSGTASTAATSSSAASQTATGGTSQGGNTSIQNTTTSQASSGSSNQASSNQGNSNQGNSGAGDFVAIEDDPLIVDASAIMDDDGMGEISVQWQISRDNMNWMNISGATQQSFTPREVHVGKRLRVLISYLDGQGNLESLVSPSSSPVQNVNDKPTGTPVLTGSAQEEDALVVDTSQISDEDGIGSYDVIWQRSSTRTEWQAFPETTSEVLRLGQSHVGYSYRAVITYIDSHGTREILISNPSETVVNVDDPVEGEVTLSGEAVEGNTLSANTGNVSDEDGIASLSVGWEYSRDGRNWRSVDTNGTASISLGQLLVGTQLRARASVVDSFGVETVIYSQPTNTVKNVNNSPMGVINVKRVGG